MQEMVHMERGAGVREVWVVVVVRKPRRTGTYHGCFTALALSVLE